MKNYIYCLYDPTFNDDRYSQETKNKKSIAISNWWKTRKNSEAL